MSMEEDLLWSVSFKPLPTRERAGRGCFFLEAEFEI
jgi:hypothetical protein